MIFYIFLFIASVAGFFFIVFRHKNELVEKYDVFSAEQPATFAHFMNDISSEFRGLWDAHMRDQILLAVEKRLRGFRIIVLRIERLLFRATHRVREASNRNNDDASVNDEAVENSESEKENKI